MSVELPIERHGNRTSFVSLRFFSNRGLLSSGSSISPDDDGTAKQPDRALGPRDGGIAVAAWQFSEFPKKPKLAACVINYGRFIIDSFRERSIQNRIRRLSNHNRLCAYKGGCRTVVQGLETMSIKPPIERILEIERERLGDSALLAKIRQSMLRQLGGKRL